MSASTIRKKYGVALQERFSDWCRDLKGYAEGKEGGVVGSQKGTGNAP